MDPSLNSRLYTVFSARGMARFLNSWILIAGIIMLGFIIFSSYLIDIDLLFPRNVYPLYKHYRGPQAKYADYGDLFKANKGADRGKAGNESDRGSDQQKEGANKGNNEAKENLEQRKARPPDFTERQRLLQESRQRTLKEVCERYPDLSKGDINVDTQRHILVNKKRKLLYCFIPKVGCSNWKRVMMRLVGKTEKPLAEITSGEAHYKHGMQKLQAYKPQEQREFLATYTSFMYVRNPFVRILSAYKNKYGDLAVYRQAEYFHQFAKKMIRKYRKDPTQLALDTGENATWTEFVMYLTDPAKNIFNEHWEEMYKLCSPCKVRYDFIGQLETLDEDARYMLDRLNLSRLVQFPSSKTSHPTNSNDVYRQSFADLTAGQLTSLWKTYRIDFELFGYPKPDFLPSNL